MTCYFDVRRNVIVNSLVKVWNAAWLCTGSGCAVDRLFGSSTARVLL